MAFDGIAKFCGEVALGLAVGASFLEFIIDRLKEVLTAL
jgi:hypothetical protein